MKAGVRDTVLRVVLPMVGIAVVVGVARMRQLSFHDDLGLRLPPLPRSAVWFAAFVVLVVLEEVLGPSLGVPAPERWGSLYGPWNKALRVFGMVVLAPISEELLFRGLLYHVIASTGLKEIGAILLTSVAFAGLHLQYGPQALLFVLADGLFYGAARYCTDSVVLTMMLHATGNAYAAFQRL
jgi:membrane protease YdiL (CAAX protease family)